MTEIKKLYALDIPAVSGSQTIWIAEELHQLPVEDAVAAHFGISRDHVIQWLNLVEDQGCQVRRKNGLPCKGHITPSDIPATPDLFNPHILYACPVHVNRADGLMIKYFGCDDCFRVTDLDKEFVAQNSSIPAKPQLTLLPCSFCGAKASDPRDINHPGRPVWEISCVLFCCNRRGKSKKDVIQYWNTRA